MGDGRRRDVLLAAALAALAGTGAAEPAPPKTDVVEVLDAVDAVLADEGGRRAPEPRSLLCDDVRPEPGRKNRGFLCDASVHVESFRLVGLKTEGGDPVQAELEVRRFRSVEQARAVRATAASRFGGKVAPSVEQGGLSWCSLDVVWTPTLLVSLEVGCHVVLKKTPALAALRADLLALGRADDDAGHAVGIAGNPGGWSWLEDARGQRVELGSTTPR
jgi:hypothetical protein